MDMRSRFMVFTGTSLVLIAAIAFGTSRSINGSEVQNHQSKINQSHPAFSGVE